MNENIIDSHFAHARVSHDLIRAWRAENPRDAWWDAPSEFGVAITAELAEVTKTHPATVVPWFVFTPRCTDADVAAWCPEHGEFPCSMKRGLSKFEYRGECDACRQHPKRPSNLIVPDFWYAAGDRLYCDYHPGWIPCVEDIGVEPGLGFALDEACRWCVREDAYEESVRAE